MGRGRVSLVPHPALFLQWKATWARAPHCFAALGYSSFHPRRRNRIQVKETTPSQNLLEAGSLTNYHVLGEWDNQLSRVMLTILRAGIPQLASQARSPPAPCPAPCPSASAVCEGGSHTQGENSERTASSTPPAGWHPHPKCPVPMLPLGRNHRPDGFTVGRWALAGACQEGAEKWILWEERAWNIRKIKLNENA